MKIQSKKTYYFKNIFGLVDRIEDGFRLNTEKYSTQLKFSKSAIGRLSNSIKINSINIGLYIILIQKNPHSCGLCFLGYNGRIILHKCRFQNCWKYFFNVFF